MFYSKRNLIILLIFCFLGIFILAAPFLESKTKTYYSGEAINYNGKIFIGSANSGNFELFILENNSIIKKNTIKSFDYESSVFHDLLFTEEHGQLYVYLVNGRYLSKYNISNPLSPVLESKVKDNWWDWFLRLEKAGNNIATIGTRGIKIWNSDCIIINAYDLVNRENFENISFSSKANYIFNIAGEKLQIFDFNKRKLVKAISFYLNESHSRKVYSSNSEDLVYIVDDRALMAFNLDGVLEKEFKHISDKGYDVDGLINSQYLYFSDGIGIVKVQKSDLKPVDWVYTTSIGAKNGWSMGLRVVEDSGGEKVIVFNDTSILIFDEKLELISYHESIEEEDRAIEPLYLKLDKNSGAPNSQISLQGGGFSPNEELIISFIKEKITQQADNQGRFIKIINVPSVLPIRTDIKVVGKYSGLNYSIAFDIK